MVYTKGAMIEEEVIMAQTTMKQLTYVTKTFARKILGMDIRSAKWIESTIHIVIASNVVRGFAVVVVVLANNLAD